MMVQYKTKVTIHLKLCKVSIIKMYDRIINMLIYKVTFKSWSQKLQLLIHTGLVLL